MAPAVYLHPSSYRDPSGFVFRKEGMLYRQVNLSFRESFERFISSGLYSDLVTAGLLVPHEEIGQNLTGSPIYYKTLKPQPLPFISYPYEWTFGMLKDAALLTLQLAQLSMKKGMMLRDATPYNIQFLQGRPVFIDTLSFGIYEEYKPWIAYRQFCETLLAPLVLAHRLRQPLHPLMLAYPDGIPLKLAATLLPRSTKWSLHSFLHIHLHAKTGPGNEKKQRPFSAKKMSNILSSLEILVNKCQPPAGQSNWSDYYTEAGDREDYLPVKTELVQQWISGLRFSSAIDLGSNTGRFAELLAEKCGDCIAIDSDPLCVETIYQRRTRGITPLIIDLSNPSPGIGLNNEERTDFISRVNGREMVLALALLHHLAIGKNIPFDRIADLFEKISGRYLLIEFVPKQDPMVQLLLQNREDVFTSYDAVHFDESFSRHFRILEKQPVGTSGRYLYLMERN